MKTILLILTVFFLNTTLIAQENQLQQVKSAVDTTSFKVEGLCGMCKKRIENAALIKGVKEASWDKNTKRLTLTYDTSKTNLQEVHQSIAKAGHDTPEMKGDDKAYAKLPSCCKYRDKSKTTH